jgi:hypothetical protein
MAIDAFGDLAIISKAQLSMQEEKLMVVARFR